MFQLKVTPVGNVQLWLLPSHWWYDSSVLEVDTTQASLTGTVYPRLLQSASFAQYYAQRTISFRISGYLPYQM